MVAKTDVVVCTELWLNVSLLGGLALSPLKCVYMENFQPS